MFEVKNLTVVHDDKIIIENLSFTLNQNDKLAIIGEEGNGKSTLVKALLGVCDYAIVSGSINNHGFSIGYLNQNTEKIEQKVFSYLFETQEDYYEKSNSLYKYLHALQMNDEILEQNYATLSGGEKVKVGILKLLLENISIYFLDEPTNDLDIETLKWLEKFILTTNKPILYVSHDETLLANTANRILHLEQVKHKTECRHTLLNIDYDTYVKTRLKRLAKQMQVAQNEKREFKKSQEKLTKIMQTVEHEQNIISRQDPHGAKVLKKKMHSLKAQEKRLNEKEFTEIPDVEENIYLLFDPVFIPKSKSILSLDLPVLKVNEKVLAKNVRLDVIGNNHVCIVGKNGVGKTTLLSHIYEILKSREDIRVGYMPQDYFLLFKDFKTVMEFLCHESVDKTKARMYLGNLNFTREEMEGNIENLSNGSKAKLILLKLILSKCNVLVLDEPTRNVSPLSNPVIRESLCEFKGCIISISHDRKYIEEVIDTVYILTKDGLKKENI